MKYKVDVILVTYNQRTYIKKALDSILSQKFDSFRVLVHDDCSDDGTKQIIEDYHKKYPDRIVPIYETHRTFIKLGFNKMIKERIVPFVESNYTAYCDGDDYWCDDNKLQFQYDFLESNKEYSMCFNPSYILEKDGCMKSRHFLGKSRDFCVNDILSDEDGIKIATSSIFLRSSVFCDFPDWRLKFPVEDFPLYLLASIKGKIRRSSFPMSVYRKFSIGSWSSSMKDYDKRLENIASYKEGITCFNIETSKKYTHLVERLLAFYDYKECFYKHDLPSLFQKKNRKYFLRLPLKSRASLFLQYRFPSLYKVVKQK